jgi:hypothetical protein
MSQIPTNSPHPVICPRCGGPMVLTRDEFRCLRCHFTLCVGCDPVLESLPTQNGQDGAKIVCPRPDPLEKL